MANTSPSTTTHLNRAQISLSPSSLSRSTSQLSPLGGCYSFIDRNMDSRLNLDLWFSQFHLGSVSFKDKQIERVDS
ncbi:hypothetical protein CUMW_053640 [Citrus unshiu]|nr:hypothetical protein CUMW_053640 [Citrus unshiu]